MGATSTPSGYSSSYPPGMSIAIEEKKPRDEEKPRIEGSFDEKSSFEVADGDEALNLVGAERTTEFSEEYNRKLRRKLVCSAF